MTKRDNRDLAAGALLAAFGATASIYALTHYSIGSVVRMGPGMVPVGLGVLLVVFGGLLAVPALFRRGEPVEFRLLTPGIVLLSILVFALSVDTIGMIPAVFLSSVLASLADRDASWSVKILLAGGLTLLAYLIFSLGLGLPMPLVRWPV